MEGSGASILGLLISRRFVANSNFRTRIHVSATFAHFLYFLEEFSIRSFEALSTPPGFILIMLCSVEAIPRKGGPSEWNGGLKHGIYRRCPRGNITRGTEHVILWYCICSFATLI